MTFRTGVLSFFRTLLGLFLVDRRRLAGGWRAVQGQMHAVIDELGASDAKVVPAVEQEDRRKAQRDLRSWTNPPEREKNESDDKHHVAAQDDQCMSLLA